MLLSPNDETASARALDLSDQPIMFEWGRASPAPSGGADEFSYLFSTLPGGRDRTSPLADVARHQVQVVEAGGPDILLLIGSVYAEVMGAEPAF